MGPPSGVGSKGTLWECLFTPGGPIFPAPRPGPPTLVGEVGSECLGGWPPD